MAAGEDQSQQVVVHDVVRRKVGPREFDHPQSVPLLARAGPLAPEDVDRLSSRGHREPGTRLWRHPGDRPRAECRQGCLLHGVLGYLYVADGPNQGREDACALDPDRLGDRVVLGDHDRLLGCDDRAHLDGAAPGRGKLG